MNFGPYAPDKRDIERQIRQLYHEIKWTEDKIAQLEPMALKQPRRQKEIDTYKNQIRDRELKIAFMEDDLEKMK
jgi:hypothetical protein